MALTLLHVAATRRANRRRQQLRRDSLRQTHDGSARQLDAHNNVNGNIVGNGGTGTITLATVLAPLGNYGGPTETHALLPYSPAINAGSTCRIPAKRLTLTGGTSTCRIAASG